jgi:hypothetical protein
MTQFFDITENSFQAWVTQSNFKVSLTRCDILSEHLIRELEPWDWDPEFDLETDILNSCTKFHQNRTRQSQVIEERNEQTKIQTKCKPVKLKRRPHYPSANKVWLNCLIFEHVSSSSPFPMFRWGRRLSSASQPALEWSLWGQLVLAKQNFPSGCPSHSTLAIDIA